MRNEKKHLQGTTVWLLLIFMTLLLGFPFFFYYKFSAVGSDMLKYDRLRISSYGSELSRYFEEIPPENLNLDTISSALNMVPLVPNLKVELYDGNGTPVLERSSLPLEIMEEKTGAYRGIKRVLDYVRNKFGETVTRDSEEIKNRILQKALNGRHGVDYIFRSGNIGDRILYFSYPLRIFTGDSRKVIGVLFLEYSDTTAGPILQKQRNQFALMCLFFVTLLLCYLLFILNVIVFPLRKLTRKLLAVRNRTGYLLPEIKGLERNNEIGEITKEIDSLSKVLDLRENEMEEYISELKHIIRNPLTIIKVSLEGLMMNKESERDLLFSQIIQNNLSRIDSYISSYNPASELSRDKTNIKDIDMNRFLNEIISIYTPLAEKKKIRFELRAHGRDIIWKGFYSHLFYACEQIISNAVDFSPENETIELELGNEGSNIIIKICDHGSGIPTGKEQEIFKQYISYRKKKDNRHTGTGLYLSVNVLRKIGGDIYARNSNNGGAVFIISLPLSV